MKKKYFKKGLISAVATVLIIVAAIAVNVLISSKDYSVDVSSNKIYTLSDQSKSIVKALDKDVTLYVINSESNVDATYKKIFQQYKKASSHISLQYKDPELYPNFVKEYGEDSSEVAADSVIVECGDKYRYLSSEDYLGYSYSGYSYTADSLKLESLVTEAINYVTADVTPNVYTLGGHSEQELASDALSGLEGDNYNIEELNLLSAGEVPEDCEVLIINGPQKDISEQERKALETYMKKDGKMYVFLDAGAENLKNLYSLLKQYSIEVEPGVVVETDSNHYTQYPIYLLPEIGYADATAAQYDSNVYILAPSAKGLKNLSTEEETAYTVSELLSTSKSAYSKVNTDSSTIEKEADDIEGPFAISLAVADENGGKMIVTGCTNMLEESIDQAVGGANKDFFLNGINYLTDQESKISIRAKDLTAETAMVPAFYQKLTLIFTVFVLPVVILGVGIVVVLRRRKK